MKYSASIKVTGNRESLLECFAPEGIDKERSKYSVKKQGGDVIFEVEAKDATALRATVNTITQLLTVHEKMKLK